MTSRMLIRAGRALALAGLLAAAACGDNRGVAVPGEDAATDAPPPIDAAIDAPIDAPPGVLAPCLERPTDLPRPPTGALPCDLLPPGLAL